MLNEANIPDAHAALLGDPHPLIERLGSPDGWAGLPATAALRFETVNSVPSLRKFLEKYRAEILFKTELPSILRAHQHAGRNEVRELIEFDAQLGREPLFREFASASQRVGRAQLRRLRPLRDHRFVKRYLGAVESGDAHGWHTLVYGVGLSLYSLPLRQGLNGYARQTLGGFIHAAARQLRLPELECTNLLEEVMSSVPPAVEATLQHGMSTTLAIVDRTA
ncbi:MAG: urease accessory UreF family protein [Verrucomicrobiota bacterium]